MSTQEVITELNTETSDKNHKGNTTRKQNQEQGRRVEAHDKITA